MLKDMFCLSDGLKVILKQSGDAVIQNRFYNGWTYYDGNLLLLTPNGKINACSLNAPGPFHDSSIAELAGVYNKLQEYFDRNGGKCVVGSAFCRNFHPFLI